MQAFGFTGVVLPTPVAECRYWHRSLNPKKLVESGFSGLGQRMTISRSIKLYKVRLRVWGVHTPFLVVSVHPKDADPKDADKQTTTRKRPLTRCASAASACCLF